MLHFPRARQADGGLGRAREGREEGRQEGERREGKEGRKVWQQGGEITGRGIMEEGREWGRREGQERHQEKRKENRGDR